LFVRPVYDFGDPLEDPGAAPQTLFAAGPTERTISMSESGEQLRLFRFAADATPGAGPTRFDLSEVSGSPNRKAALALHDGAGNVLAATEPSSHDVSLSYRLEADRVYVLEAYF